MTGFEELKKAGWVRWEILVTEDAEGGWLVNGEKSERLFGNKRDKIARFRTEKDGFILSK